MACDHDRGFDLMDRCRACGYELSPQEQREREDSELRGMRDRRHRDSSPTEPGDAQSEALF